MNLKDILGIVLFGILMGIILGYPIATLINRRVQKLIPPCPPPRPCGRVVPTRRPPPPPLAMGQLLITVEVVNSRQEFQYYSMPEHEFKGMTGPMMIQLTKRLIERSRIR